ncbi:MAG: aminodeoxychorismate/anthranilate synthase component II [Bdellovibrionota bacterium]
MQTLRKLSIVMIDNYDSFTFNLVQYLLELGPKVKTIRNDEKTVQEVLAYKPDAIIISPGPSTPEHAGICLELVENCATKKIPIFGVCLGHQTIGQVFKARVIQAELPMHGKVSDIFHRGQGIFKGLANPLKATRYHSLILDTENFPEELTITAKSKEGIIMGVRHTSLLIEGVQFHPESVLTEHGKEMLKNFCCEVVDAI